MELNIKHTPVFIIGNNRSGTSLLRLMLTCHENIVIPPESHFLLWLSSKYFNWKIDDGVDNFLIDLYNATKFETWKLEKRELKKHLLNRKPFNYSELISEIYLIYGEKQNKSISLWGDKNSLWVEKLPTLIKLYPKAKFIHVVRDGRDVATSYQHLNKVKYNVKYYPNLPNEIHDIAHTWSYNIREIIEFKKQLSDKSFLEVKYEDLILNNKSEIERIFDFLSISISENVFRYHELNRKSKYEPIELMRWKEKLNQPLDKSNINKYLKNLSQNEITAFELIAQKELLYYGYIK